MNTISRNTNGDYTKNPIASDKTMTMTLTYAVPPNGAIPATSTRLAKRTLKYPATDEFPHCRYYDYLKKEFRIDLNDNGWGFVGNFYWFPLIDQIACRRVNGSTALLSRFGTRGVKCVKMLVAARQAMWNEKWNSDYVPCVEIRIEEGHAS